MIEGTGGCDLGTTGVALASACEDHGRRGALSFRPLHLGVRRETGRLLDAWATIAGLAAPDDEARAGHARLAGDVPSPVRAHTPPPRTADEISGGPHHTRDGSRLDGAPNTKRTVFAFDNRAPCESRGSPSRSRSRHVSCTRSASDFEGNVLPNFTTLRGSAGRTCRSSSAGVRSRARREPAVRFADEYNTLFGNARRSARRAQAGSRRSLRGKGGRDPATLRYSLMAPCVLGRDEREVNESARRIGAARFGRDPKDVLLRYGRARPRSETVDQAIEHLKEIPRARLRAGHAPASRPPRPSRPLRSSVAMPRAGRRVTLHLPAAPIERFLPETSSHRQRVVLDWGAHDRRCGRDRDRCEGVDRQSVPDPVVVDGADAALWRVTGRTDARPRARDPHPCESLHLPLFAIPGEARIVVFHAPAAAARECIAGIFVKRIIGLPGERWSEHKRRHPTSTAVVCRSRTSGRPAGDQDTKTLLDIPADRKDEAHSCRDVPDGG